MRHHNISCCAVGACLRGCLLAGVYHAGVQQLYVVASHSTQRVEEQCWTVCRRHTRGEAPLGRQSLDVSVHALHMVCVCSSIEPGIHATTLCPHHSSAFSLQAVLQGSRSSGLHQGHNNSVWPVPSPSSCPTNVLGRCVPGSSSKAGPCGCLRVERGSLVSGHMCSTACLLRCTVRTGFVVKASFGDGFTTVLRRLCDELAQLV